MRRRSAAAAAAVALALGWPAAAREIRPADLDRLPAAAIVILGEVHDNPVHHRNQAQALAALKPRAVVFEMLTADAASRAAPALRRDPVALEAVLGWNASGWPDFALYAPLFAAVPEARIVGGAVPDERLRVARAEGAAAAFEGTEWHFGLDRPLDPADRQRREAEMQSAHCNALPEASLAGFVEVQRLRDATLAAAALDALAKTGGPVAVITGNGHARRDSGIPDLIARATPDAAVLTIGQLEAAPDNAPPFDLWLVTPAPDRSAEPSPCAAFADGPTGGG